MGETVGVPGWVRIAETYGLLAVLIGLGSSMVVFALREPPPVHPILAGLGTCYFKETDVERLRCYDELARRVVPKEKK